MKQRDHTESPHGDEVGKFLRVALDSGSFTYCTTALRISNFDSEIRVLISLGPHAPIHLWYVGVRSPRENVLNRRLELESGGSLTTRMLTYIFYPSHSRPDFLSPTVRFSDE
jgi:hypothetical protein